MTDIYILRKVEVMSIWVMLFNVGEVMTEGRGDPSDVVFISMCELHNRTSHLMSDDFSSAFKQERHWVLNNQTAAVFTQMNLKRFFKKTQTYQLTSRWTRNREKRTNCAKRRQPNRLGSQGALPHDGL